MTDATYVREALELQVDTKEMNGVYNDELKILQQIVDSTTFGS